MIAAVSALGGCSSDTAGASPEVDGAHDIDCVTNSSVDLLDGVAALDDEDGDITPDMVITIAPNVEVTNGYATFEEEGSYRVTYSVTDSDGNTASDTAIITAVERETYLDFVSVNGFRGVASGGASLTRNGMYDGVYYIEATGCEIAEDVQLTRTFTLTNDIQYTFTYEFNSSAGGRAYVYADGAMIKEFMAVEGDNSVTFTYTASGDGDSSDVEISFLIGGLGEYITFNLQSAGYGYPQEAGTVDLLDGFAFDSNNVIARFDGTSGNAYASDDGTVATLEITTVTEYSDGIWRGGMFINTGITTSAGTEYTISFDIVSAQANEFEVVIQRDQWNETKYETVSISDATAAQSITKKFTPASSSAGDLWIYVQSGTAINTITISNLKILATYDGGVQTENIALNDFTASNSEGYEGYLTTSGGSFIYEVPEFSSTDWHQQVISPEFYVSGSGSNYVITFKAKATKTISVVFAAPVYGGWDPTLAWSRINITEEEQEFVIWCSDNGGNTNYLVWQFGATANLAYKNVTIEISDIKVCYKNNDLD